MKISIIIPVYNEEKLINDCLEALINQNYPKDDYEIIVVNDGSTDNTLKVIEDKQIKIINLEPNQGWITARETGAKNARYENLLFIDSRCVADSEILNNLEKINYQPVVGNAIIDQDRSIFDRFGMLFRKKLYAEYFGENFKSVYITPDNYDDIPKGTTVLFCGKDLFLSSQPKNKSRWISDDIRLLRNIVEKKPLLKHPNIKVKYQSRDSFKSVFEHIFKRGIRFTDYYLSLKKKYFWFFILPSIIVLAAVIFVLIKQVYFIYFLTIVILIWILASLWLAENIKDLAIVLILLPLFAISFWAGIFYGLALKARGITRNKIIILIFLIVLLSGFFWNQKIFGQPISSDQGLYDGIAVNILNGKGFTYYGRDLGIEPLYPLFLAGIYKTFGHNYDAVRIIQIFLFAFLAIFIYLIAEKLFGGKIALYSALATALFPSLAIEAGNITTEMLFTFLLIISVLAFYRASLKDNNLWLASAGIFLALAAMTRSILQFFIIVAVVNVFIVYYQRASFKMGLFKTGILLLAFFATLLPWYAHNGYSEVTIAPRAGGGLAARVERMEKFYPDYADHFIGRLFGYYFSEKLGFQASYEDYRNVAGTSEIMNTLIKSGKSENEIDQQLTSSALKTILKEPYKYIAISFLDFISFNSPILPRDNHWRNTLEIHPMFAEGRHPEIPDWLKTSIILGIRFIWFAFLGLAAYALVKNIKDWQKISWIFLIILYFNLAYSAVHAIPRYALPIYPFYIILAIVGLNTFYGKNKE